MQDILKERASEITKSRDRNLTKDRTNERA